MIKTRKMNTPVTMFEQILPQELLDQIQQYLTVNDEVKNAIKKYYDYLYDGKISDDEKAFEKNVYPLCVCSNCPDNGREKIFKRKECWYCDEYEMKAYNGNYANDKFHLVITNNPQYKKIAYDIKEDEENTYEDCDNIWYNQNDIWLE